MECSERLILASGSPRRRELLERFGVPFEIIPAKGEERAPDGLAPDALVIALASAKAKEIADAPENREAVILAADTVVELDGKILGKPHGEGGAREMLRSLSGRTHRVRTGLCVRKGDRVLTHAECTSVIFRELSDAEIEAYVRTGEPMDKAGAYGVQGRGALLVRRIEGDYYNVMGLPLVRLSTMLGHFGITLL